jgi:alanyl-tRNA synthetase
VISQISASLNINQEEVLPRFLEMQKELKKLRKNADNSSLVTQKIKLEPAFEIKGSKVYHHIAEGISNPHILKEMNDTIKSQETDFISLLFSGQGDKISYVAGSGQETQKKLSARDLASIINSLLDGKGGGRADMTQGNVAAINEDLLEKLLEKVKEKL